MLAFRQVANLNLWLPLPLCANTLPVIPLIIVPAQHMMATNPFVPLNAPPRAASSVVTQAPIIIPDTATRHPLLTERNAISRSTAPLATQSAMTFRAGDTASHGIVPPVATAVTTASMDSISAPSVGIPHTMLSCAPTSDFFSIITPFIPDAWEETLIACNLINIYPDIPTFLRFGFDMGVLSKLTATYTPPNHSSSLLSPDAIDAHINKELSLRRYTGPFSRSHLELIIGPFRSSPLGTVNKAGSSGELRVIQDLSFPRSDPFISSVNAEIDILNFQCTWGSFHEVCLMVITAPPGTEAATLNVDSAFCCCPILPSQHPHFIIGWKDLFYIDHNAPFGASSSGGVFGRLADAFIDILKKKGISSCYKWVDDFQIFCFPLFIDGIPSFAFDIPEIYDIVSN